MSDLMKFNSTPSDKKNIEVMGDAEEWKAIAMKLWKLLDDIDTASDMFKPQKNNFYEYVIKKSMERHKFIKSNGYNLILTKECLTNINEK